MRKTRYGTDLTIMRDVKRVWRDPSYGCWLPIKGSVDRMIRHFAKHLFKKNGKCRRCGKMMRIRGRWAVKVKDKDVYMAEQQHYGPPGSFTVSSRKGNPPIYTPKIFDTREEAERGLVRAIRDAEDAPFKDAWEVVDFDLAGTEKKEG